MPTGGGGGGGGLSSVTTDGVTIQGAGTVPSPVALKAAQTDASLQGAGTVASPLALKTVSVGSTLTGAGTSGSPISVANWPVNFFTTTSAEGTSVALGANNRIALSGFSIAAPLTCGHLAVWVQTSDAVGSYDFGVYNAAGNLVINVGAQTLASTGWQAFAITQTSVTLTPGLYAFGWTGTATTLKLFQANNVGSWVVNSNAGTSSGGVLNGSITAPTLTVAAGQYNFALY